MKRYQQIILAGVLGGLVGGGLFVSRSMLDWLIVIYIAGGVLTTLATVLIWRSQSTKGETEQPGYWLKWFRTILMVFLVLKQATPDSTIG